MTTPHENDGKSLKEIFWKDSNTLTAEQSLEAVAAEVRRRDGDKVRELEQLNSVLVLDLQNAQAEVERLKGEVAKLIEQRETISEARDHVARELWKAKEKFSADWEAREKEVDAMRDSVRRQGEIVVLLQRENEDLKRAEKERPERKLEAFTKAAMQGLCAPVFAAMPNGDWPSISLDVEDEIARTAKSIAEKTLAALRKEQE